MLNIKKRKLTGLVFLICFGIFSVLLYMGAENKKEMFLKNGLDTNIKGELLEEIESPNSKHIMSVKGKRGSLLNEPYIFVEIENMLLGKKVIYMESDTDKYEAEWLDNENISINGNVLNIKEDNLKLVD